MYYTRLGSWDMSGTEPVLNYSVWGAASSDGLAWTRVGAHVIAHEPGEYALGAPAHYTWDRDAHIYFTARGSRYRLFVTVGRGDGTFRRAPGPIAIAPGDWDDQMQCYPQARTIDGGRYLFYCGNGYGRAGVGYAAWNPRAASVESTA
jgi:hypothetical protein